MESQRLVADPCVSVQDLLNAIITWVTTAMCTDVYKLLSHPAGLQASWKSAPQIEWMCKVAPFFALLAKICPNTVLTSKKVITAFKLAREKKHITSSSEKAPADFDDWCDQCVRILFAQFRELKRNTVVMARCQKKCSKEQWHSITCVLDKIQLPDNSKASATCPPIPLSWSAATSLCNGTATSSTSNTNNMFGIFKKYLQRNAQTQNIQQLQHVLNSLLFHIQNLPNSHPAFSKLTRMFQVQSGRCATHLLHLTASLMAWMKKCLKCFKLV
jgi:hypothetical protein